MMTEKDIIMAVQPRSTMLHSTHTISATYVSSEATGCKNAKNPIRDVKDLIACWRKAMLGLTSRIVVSHNIR